jgi:hypothetical protein
MDVGRSAFTIQEFCYRNHICRASYYNLKKAGKGPREMIVGGMVRITGPAEAKWQQEREAERAAEGEVA